LRLLASAWLAAPSAFVLFLKFETALVRTPITARSVDYQSFDVFILDLELSQAAERIGYTLIAVAPQSRQDSQRKCGLNHGKASEATRSQFRLP
jgi:hypothetical protein